MERKDQVKVLEKLGLSEQCFRSNANHEIDRKKDKDEVSGV
jgi:hypothetical protein